MTRRRRRAAIHQQYMNNMRRGVRASLVGPAEIPAVDFVEFNGFLNPAHTAVDAVTGSGLWHGMWVSPDGTELFMAEEGQDSVYQYTMSTAFDPTPATLTGQNDFLEIARMGGMTMNPDMSKIWVTEYTGNTIDEYELLTPGDITSVNETALKIWSNVVGDGHANGMSWSFDGLKLYFVTFSGLGQITVSTPYDMTTITDVVDQEVTGSEVHDLQISEDGLMIWLLWGETPGKVRQVPLSVAFDITSAAATVDSDDDWESNSGNAAALSFFYFPAREELWIQDGTADDIFTYVAL